MTPGTPEGLDRLPPGTILCNSGDITARPDEIERTWRKNPDESWTLWVCDKVANGHHNMQPDSLSYPNLSAWTIHPASPYIITEDDELEEMTR